MRVRRTPYIVVFLVAGLVAGGVYLFAQPQGGDRARHGRRAGPHTDHVRHGRDDPGQPRRRPRRRRPLRRRGRGHVCRAADPCRRDRRPPRARAHAGRARARASAPRSPRARSRSRCRSIPRRRSAPHSRPGPGSTSSRCPTRSRPGSRPAPVRARRRPRSWARATSSSPCGPPTASRSQLGLSRRRRQRAALVAPKLGSVVIAIPAASEADFATAATASTFYLALSQPGTTP